MERQPDSQSFQIAGLPVETARPVQSHRGYWLLLLFFMTLWPWFWVSLGLFTLKDYRATMGLYELVCCGLPLLLLRSPKVALWPLSVQKRYIAIAILASNIMFLGLFKQTGGVLLDWSVFGSHTHAIGLGLGPEFWLYGAYLVFLNPLFEESFWRGTVYREWRTRIGPWPANLLSSFFFGAWHWIILQYYCDPFWALYATGTVMIGGVIFAYCYEKTGSLGASVILHGLGADLPLVFIAHTALLQHTGG